MKNKDGLTPKQERFCREYLVDVNGTQAAIRAGYSKKTAGAIGVENLTKPLICRYLGNAMKKREEKLEISTEFVVNNFKEISDRCMQKKPVMVFDRENKCYVQAVDEETGEGIWEFDAANANKANEHLGRHLGIFNDKLNLSGAVSFDVVEKLKSAIEKKGKPSE